MVLPVRKVFAASWSAAGDSMGTLVDEGIMTKEYDYTYRNTRDIVWTLHTDADVIVDNGHERIHPGQSVRWEK